MEIPYNVTGYSKSMARVGPWFGGAAGSSLKCAFAPGSPRPKQATAKCNKTMVDLETKIRYNQSFYDPYQNRCIIPDYNQNVIFFPPHDAERNKRQVFAAIAIVKAFAVQGAVDYAGYEGIQGVEQELNDEMNTRADCNNAKFRQADSAIGRSSGQIQDSNAKVTQLSEEDATTAELLLRNVKTQAQENVILQQQIDKNNRVLVDLARAHLREVTANRRMDDAATFLLKTIVSVKPVKTVSATRHRIQLATE